MHIAARDGMQVSVHRDIQHNENNPAHIVQYGNKSVSEHLNYGKSLLKAHGVLLMKHGANITHGILAKHSQSTYNSYKHGI